MTKLPVQTVRVAFQETIDWGGIPVTVSCGDKSVSLCAIDCCDPFPAMLRWLEAITTGVLGCYFDIDEEGTDKQLTLKQYCDDSWFSIVNTYDEEEIFIRAVVDPVQLVQAFYLGLKEYAQSPLYIKEHWEVSGCNLADLKSPMIVSWLADRVPSE